MELFNDIIEIFQMCTNIGIGVYAGRYWFFSILTDHIYYVDL